eukprot:155199-Ditylum_brightwellii.AAC.1
MDHVSAFHDKGIQPLCIVARASVSNDAMFTQAMSSPDADGFCNAMDLEMGTWRNMKSWIAVERRPCMSVLGSTWAFKVKQFPNDTTNTSKSPQNFFKHLLEKLCKVGMEASEHDPCLFFTDHVNCLVYVNNCLFLEPKQKGINDLLNKIQGEGMVFNIKNDATSFLGVTIGRVTVNKTTTLAKIGLIEHMMTTLGLDDNSNTCRALAKLFPLVKDLDGKKGNNTFNYLIVIGMMLYLSSHS